MRFAPVGARLGAVLVDVIVGALGLALLTVLFLLGAGQSPAISAASALVCVVLVRGVSLAVSGWSLGGRVAGVRLVSASTRRPSPLGVFLRADITLVVMLPTLGLGGIALLRSVAADPQRRGWHDRTSGMMVIATRAKGQDTASQAERRTQQTRQRAQEQGQDRARDRNRDSARRLAVDAATSPRGRGPGASQPTAPSDPQPAAESAAESATESWSASSEHSWPRVTPPAADPARAWNSGQPPTSRTPEEPGHRAATEGRGEETASSWGSHTRPGTIGANPVTSQPMDARPAKEQPWQPRPEQAASPAAPPEAAEPQASRGPVPPRESLFTADRSFTASGSRYSDVAHTFDTASVLPAADRSTQALIDSVPWSSVPTSLDSTTMDSLPDQIRSAMQHDEQGQRYGAAHSQFADTESLTPVSASSPASPAGRHRTVNLLDPQEVPSARDGVPLASSAGASGGSAAQAEEPGLPRSISPGSRPATGASPLASPAPAGSAASPAPAGSAASPAPAGSAASPASAATPSPYAASPASHLAPPSSISAPYGGSRAAHPASSASQPASPAVPYAASHAAPTSHSASSAPARPHRVAQHRAPDAETPDPGAQDQGSQVPRRPVPPTVEVPRVSRRRRASTRSHQAPAAMPPTMPRPSTANPPLSVRLIPMTGGDPLIIHEPTVVGRDPDNISDYPGAERISLSDPTRSVSKTHAAIFPLLDGVWVTDLHSTNGTRVEGKDGSSLPATPEEPLAAMDGSTIFFGRIGFRVEVI